MTGCQRVAMPDRHNRPDYRTFRLRRLPRRLFDHPYELELTNGEGNKTSRMTRNPLRILEPLLGMRDARVLVNAADHARCGDGSGAWVCEHLVASPGAMAQAIERQAIECHSLYRLSPLLENLELRRCTFESCQHPAQRRLDDRPLLRNVKLTRCHVSVSDLGPVIAEDCLIDTIWFHRGKSGPQKIAGCAFKHVTIRGNITGAVRFLASPRWYQWQTDFLRRSARQAGDERRDGLPQTSQQAQRAHEPRSRLLPSQANRYACANARYYADVDWALDISEARFTGVELYFSGIPARLIRRDPDTQVVVHRDVLLGSPWRDVLADNVWQYSIEYFLETGFDDTVLVAETRGRYFAQDLDAIHRLREAGLADPD